MFACTERLQLWQDAFFKCEFAHTSDSSFKEPSSKPAYFAPQSCCWSKHFWNSSWSWQFWLSWPQFAVSQPQAKQNKARTLFIPALSSLFHLLAIFQKEAPTAPAAAESLTLGLPSSFYWNGFGSNHPMTLQPPNIRKYLFESCFAPSSRAVLSCSFSYFLLWSFSIPSPSLSLEALQGPRLWA